MIDAPRQSPKWDCIVSLAQMLEQARFMVLLKRQVHGDLVAIVREEGLDAQGQFGYSCWLLTLDRYGVDCKATGWLSPANIDAHLARGWADLCCDPHWALRHLWEVQVGHPNSRKLFTEYEDGNQLRHQ